MLLIVCVGLCGVFYAPYALGYYWPGGGLTLVAAEALFAWYALRPASAGRSIPAWAQHHPILFGAILLFFGGLTVTGVVNGIDARERGALEAIEQARSEQEAARQREAQALAEREARARQELEERLRTETERAAEARRTPQDRAAIASNILIGGGELHDRVCGARRALARVRPEDRAVPEVRAALRQLRAAERDDLREFRASFRQGRHILCSDGWASSCECSRSNRRGCCSWHGGIRGCEPLPTEITCPDAP